MTKRMSILAIVVIVLVAPSMAISANVHKFAAAKATIGDNNEVIVPLEITNQERLAGLDIPLKYSDGVVLKEVDFANTRVDYFDLKIANINTENQTVVIGLLPQLSEASKPDLEAGSGVIANLVFEIVDPTVEEVSLDAVEMHDPYHALTYVYHDDGPKGLYSVQPDFESVSVAFVQNLPQEFELAQNYPNPFNPSTIISYSLPTNSHVNLSVFNVLGQKVVTLVDEEQQVGYQEATFDGSAYSSGVYFYRLTTGDRTETRKMLMLK